MTTITYRAGTMAADSRAYAGYNAALGQKTKIRRLDDGTLIGCSSVQPGMGEAVMDWYARGAKIDDAPKGEAKFTFLAVKPSGVAYFASDSFNLSGPIRAQFFAIGSGEGAAQGAMHAGASAELAIEIACAVDVWSALPVVTLRHDVSPWWFVPTPTRVFSCRPAADWRLHNPGRPLEGETWYSAGDGAWRSLPTLDGQCG